MEGKKCPKCGKSRFYLNQTKTKAKGECKNCGFKMQMPLVKIYSDGPRPSVIDKFNSELIQKKRSRGKNG